MKHNQSVSTRLCLCCHISFIENPKVYINYQKQKKESKRWKEINRNNNKSKNPVIYESQMGILKNFPQELQNCTKNKQGDFITRNNTLDSFDLHRIPLQGKKERTDLGPSKNDILDGHRNRKGRKQRKK